MARSVAMRIKRAFSFLVFVMMSLPVHAQATRESSRFWHHGGDWGWGHTVFGGLMMLLFWGGIVVLIVLAVRWLGRNGQAGARSSKTPLDILEERFARGEIDAEEFEKRKKALSR